jgi:hypothetical protein
MCSKQIKINCTSVLIFCLLLYLSRPKQVHYKFGILDYRPTDHRDVTSPKGICQTTVRFPDEDEQAKVLINPF